MMNKKMLALSMALAFSGLVGVSHAQEAVSNDITLTGHVLESTSCVVDAPASMEFNNVALVDIGTIASKKPYENIDGSVYDISVTECPAGQDVSVTVLGTPAAEDNNLFALDDIAGSAQHVGLVFWQNDIEHGNAHKVLVPNTGSSSVVNTESKGSVHLPLGVAPAQTASSTTVVPGTISANVNVKVNFL